MTMDGKLPSNNVMSRTRTLCIVMSIGIAVFLGRILYERHVLHVVDDRPCSSRRCTRTMHSFFGRLSYCTWVRMR